MFHHQLGILGLDVYAGSDRAASDSQVAQVVCGFNYTLEPSPQRAAVRLELLPKPDRHRVLEVRASRLQHLVEFLPFFLERLRESLERLLEAAQLS